MKDRKSANCASAISGTHFGQVAVGETLLYLNSLNRVSLAINQGNFADTFHIGSGASWNIEIEK